MLKKDYKLPQFNRSKILGISLAILVNYTYTNLPSPNITNINPSIIPTTGGTGLSISGSGFLDYGPIDNLTSITAGSYHTCGLDGDGNGYCWGYNNNSQLGNGSTTQSTTPVLVSQGARPAGVTFMSISAGSLHTCGLGSDGNGYCWGRNTNGQLGNGSTSQSTTPVLVSQGARPGGVTFTSISAGDSHTCGLGGDGNAYCWGQNTYGQLGNGSTTQSTTPVLVSQGARPAGVTFTSITAGKYYTCGLGSDGNGYCWGQNTYGQLGNGSTTQSTTPVLVSQGARPGGVTFTSISTGTNYTCGLGSDGNGYCWGYNYNGQLGNMETTNRVTPSYIIMKKNPKIEIGVTLVPNTTYNSTISMSATTPTLPTYGLLPVKLTNPDGQYATYNITVIAPPSAPLNLVATKGNTKATLVWSTPTDNGGSTITDYVIQYSNNGGSTWTTLPHTPSTNTTVEITGLTNGIAYQFRVAAVNSVGTGPYSNIATATPTDPPPTFTSITNTSPTVPGGSIAWNATATDDIGVKLLVCKTAGITNGVCNGGAWCTSSLVSSNPSCTYNVPAGASGGSNNAYVYIVDSNNQGATGALQGSNSPYTVSNVTPDIQNIIINGGSAISLAESTTIDIEISTTITNGHGCAQTDSVKAYLYRSGVGYSNCDIPGKANANNCYPEITCVQDVGSCTGGSDITATYTCTVPMEYYADPTDSNTEFSAQNWKTTIKATGTNTLSSTVEIVNGVEVNSLLAMRVLDEYMIYSPILAGESNATLNTTITSIPTGNVGLDQRHYGDNKGMCTNYPTCTGGTPIPISSQRYATTPSTPYSSGTPLSSTATLVGLKIPKMRGGTLPSKLSYWGISIPLGTKPGEYEGRNYIDAVKSSVGDW